MPTRAPLVTWQPTELHHYAAGVLSQPAAAQPHVTGLAQATVFSCTVRAGGMRAAHALRSPLPSGGLPGQARAVPIPPLALPSI